MAARRLGLRIRSLREEKGLTLEKAAAAAELDLTHWQKAEAGKVNLTLVTLLRIADGLGLALTELFLIRDGRGADDDGHLKGARSNQRRRSN
jgi:transcriptional regulator with XRE-family HTH domain